MKELNHTKSEAIFKEAIKYIPGGVNSPVRAFGSVGLNPIFIDRAKGSKIYDVDGNEYIDYICSWGPLILGHSNEALFEGIEETLRRGTSYGVPTKIEVEMAKLITEAYPSVDMVRMVNSGTEATMSALRVARGYTGRNKILKFEGCYHGHSDALLVKSGSGTITFGVPTSPGVPEGTVKDTLVCRYNDIEAVRKIFEEQGNEIAAVIVEPVSGNMGVVPGKKEFLQFLRKVTKEYKSVLIFDEVITGFRLAYGGAQEVYGIQADMTCFGKIIGAGLPVGAYGGKRKIMECVSPVGPVYQAGTLSGNPLAMHMGYKNLSILKENKDIYDKLEEKAIKLEKGFKENIKSLGIKATVVRFKAMLCLFFAEGSLDNFEDVTKCDTEMYAKYFGEMLKRGILIAPAQFEALFLSTAHSDEDIEYTIKANYEALKELKQC
ncbi:glutamate-1-semialdehyde 2,1-aminomutase [Clostridium botulinum D/C]|uniref:glutamate-1-semialdehyde 2,1-aminomutase n=1 Tax=Clostridium botulinum TaxID=1491 RepID=UPI001E3F678D|nr:glutamate-1-semialdehyde 2,1-aminomutase [Clostridium botulinum]MCD3351974.1 glutamate-1-semialdehyde 2,1-aminomutase [Clostridium botulinum D/C]MCD3360922.1 glutamate-1-semialdehyde 2,1-aminomutase [Clostridium botulinum D/C]MCD3362767.1 glutamate-1-semialdehyde 2,1-aminomutase [Clostridium botulinum D/C]MCD3366662.1 glutamate-1-semialdehyde 2,1-aminomutase [Clostridium botulinum D/C]